MWVLRPWAEARQRQVKLLITAGWVDVGKGDDLEPNYRSRLVARKITCPGVDTVYALTRCLEILRTIPSIAATTVDGELEHARDSESEQHTQISAIRIPPAYLFAECDPSAPTYVELAN